MASRTIELKFDIGDTVYCMTSRFYKTASDAICPVCAGTGKYIGPSRTIATPCPGVLGYTCLNGKMAFSKYKFFPTQYIIDEIRIDDCGIEYQMDNDMMYPEAQVFSTMEEAQAECDRRNSDKEPV